jgi:hypothetical protein
MSNGMIQAAPNMDGEHPAVIVACSLAQAALGDRRRRWRQLAERAAIDCVTTADGQRLVFRAAPRVEAELRQLVELERECCAFAEWTVEKTDQTVVLDVTADTTADVAAIHAMFDPLLIESSLAHPGATDTGLSDSRFK